MHPAARVHWSSAGCDSSKHGPAQPRPMLGLRCRASRASTSLFHCRTECETGSEECARLTLRTSAAHIGPSATAAHYEDTRSIRLYCRHPLAQTLFPYFHLCKNYPALLPPVIIKDWMPPHYATGYGPAHAFYLFGRAASMRLYQKLPQSLFLK